MDAIQLTGSDAARITLALIADRRVSQSGMSVGQLQGWWQELGLRADDLIQGLSVLSRNGDLRIEGEGQAAAVYLQAQTLASLPSPGAGLSGLAPRLQGILKQAADRHATDSGTPPDQERRGGFK